MANSDFSTWTPLEFVGRKDLSNFPLHSLLITSKGNLILKWAKGDDCPASGSLMSLITKNGETNVVLNNHI